LENLAIVITGDHANYYAEGPPGRDNSLGTRTHYEDIEVPRVIVGGEKLPADVGMIDSMGVTATFLDVLGVQGEPSFKGVSAYDGGRVAVVSESCGFGAADLVRRDIFFTVTTPTHRMMTILVGTDFRPVELYDIVDDPREVNDLIADPASGPVIEELTAHILRERAELLKFRDAEYLPARSDTPQDTGSQPPIPQPFHP
jgi:hypothetical protein